MINGSDGEKEWGELKKKVRFITRTDQLPDMDVPEDELWICAFSPMDKAIVELRTSDPEAAKAMEQAMLEVASNPLARALVKSMEILAKDINKQAGGDTGKGCNNNHG